MDKTKMNIYRHPNPGFTLALWFDGQAIKSKNGKSNAVFKDTGYGADRCGIFRTDEEEIAKAVEQSRAFKNKAIVRLKSADEIKFETLKKERAAFRKKMQEMAQGDLFNFDTLKEKKVDELRDFAVNIGIDVDVQGGRLPKATILAEVEKVLYQKEETQ